MGFLCILLLQLFFLTTQSSKAVRTLPKFGSSIAVAHLCSMLLSSLWCALNFTVILDCSEFYLVKFWISARLRFHSCTWQPLPVFSKPSLWGFFFNAMFSSSSTLALYFHGVSHEYCTSSFYYTLPKTCIWLLYISTLDSLRQQANP